MSDQPTTDSLVPAFGPLSGVRVISAGSIVAMPHAANMMADFGAEVIHIERPETGDNYRGLSPLAEWSGKAVSTGWIQDARNRLSLTLNLNLAIPEVKEVFLNLVAKADIFMENLVWLEKYGISDALLLETNPRLVIVHVSGYGRPEFGGLPEVCNRASYDLIGQAYSGMMHLNGETAPAAPMLAKPWVNDFISALHALFGALAGYIHAQKTGRGQVVDVAQFEAGARVLSDLFVAYTETGDIRTRTGGLKGAAFQPYGIYRDRTGRYVVIGAFGPSVYKRFLQALALDPAEFPFAECGSSIEAVSSEKGRKLDAAVTSWAAARSTDEIVDCLSRYKVAAAPVNTVADAVNDPHWQSRGDFIEYEDQTLGKTVTAFGLVPKFSLTPGTVWRGAPTLGQDTDTVLGTLLGYSPDQIKALHDKKLI